MKQIDNKWLGHVITPRSDVIIPIQTEAGYPKRKPFLMVMEVVAMAWGPVFFTPDQSRYKTMKRIGRALKKKAVVVPTLTVLMVLLLGVVGILTFFANRKKEADDQKSLQKRKAFLLADWGDEHFEGRPIWQIEEEQSNQSSQTNNSEENVEVEPSYPHEKEAKDPLLPASSDKVMISDSSDTDN